MVPKCKEVVQNVTFCMKRNHENMKNIKTQLKLSFKFKFRENPNILNNLEIGTRGRVLH